MSCKRCGVPLPKFDKDETSDYCGFCHRKYKNTYSYLYGVKLATKHLSNFKLFNNYIEPETSSKEDPNRRANQEWINRTKEQVIRELRENLKA